MSPALITSRSFDLDMRKPALATASSRMLASTLFTRSVLACLTRSLSRAICRVWTGTVLTCTHIEKGSGVQGEELLVLQQHSAWALAALAAPE